MSISDTQAAKKFASIAEVAAAQTQAALQQALKAPDYANDALNYANEAQGYSVNAESSSDSASQSQETALLSASNASGYSVAAQESASESSASASLAQQAASDAGDTYASTAAGLAATTSGQYFRVPQGTGSSISFIYYLNDSGNATAVAQQVGQAFVQEAVDDAIAPYSGLLPLADNAEFISLGIPGTQYEAVTDIDVLIDEDKHIIRCIRGGKQMFFVPIWAKEVTGDKLTISGVEIDPNGIPPAILSTNLLGLAKGSSFLDPSSFDAGGQYEAVKDQDIITDGSYHLLRCIRDGVQKYFIPVDTQILSTNKFLINGSLEFVDSTLFSQGGQLEAWSEYSDIKTDENNNILSYIKDGVRVDLIPYKTPSIDAASIKLSGVEIKDALGIKIADRIPYEQVVSGKSQVFVFDKESCALAQITDGTANETKPIINDAGLLTWESDRDSTVIAGKFFQAETGKIYPLISRTVISGWGDSFMEQPVLMNKLQSLTGLACYNFGKSGLRSTAVASRQGGEPFYCMPDGGIIPASGSVNLLPNVPGPAASAANGAMTGIKCSLGGVDGTFNWSGTQATFIRDATGSTASVPAAVPLFVYPYTTSTVVNSIATGTLYNQHDEAILIVTCGRNNTTISAEVLRNITNIIGYLKPYGKRFVVCPQFTQSTETRGTDGYQRIHTINAALKAAFPNNYVEIDGVDLMQNFKNHYNPAYAQDVTDIANDTTPTSLRTDALHPSQVLQSNALYIGAEVNANFIYQFIKLKGWVA